MDEARTRAWKITNYKIPMGHARRKAAHDRALVIANARASDLLRYFSTQSPCYMYIYIYIYHTQHTYAGGLQHAT